MLQHAGEPDPLFQTMPLGVCQPGTTPYASLRPGWAALKPYEPERFTATQRSSAAVSRLCAGVKVDSLQQG